MHVVHQERNISIKKKRRQKNKNLKSKISISIYIYIEYDIYISTWAVLYIVLYMNRCFTGPWWNISDWECLHFNFWSAGKQTDGRRLFIPSCGVKPSSRWHIVLQFELPWAPRCHQRLGTSDWTATFQASATTSDRRNVASVFSSPVIQGRKRGWNLPDGLAWNWASPPVMSRQQLSSQMLAAPFFFPPSNSSVLDPILNALWL